MSSLIAIISCYTGTWNKYWSLLWFICDTTAPWDGPSSNRQPLQRPGSCSRQPTYRSPELLLLYFFFLFFFSITEVAASRQTRGILAPQGKTWKCSLVKAKVLSLSLQLLFKGVPRVSARNLCKRGNRLPLCSPP